MAILNKWRNPIVIFAISVMLAVTVYASFAAAGDINDAADGGVQIGAISKAAADFELAWFQMMGADALAATGEAPAEAQGFYDGGLALYNQSKAVLQAADREPINLAIAGSDQALVMMNAAFEGTMALAASGDIAAATSNHMDGTVVLYSNVEPAVKGLAQVGVVGDERLTARLNSGAADLRMLGWISVAVVALGAVFAGWSAWSIYRREDEDAAESATSDQSSSWSQAA